MKNFPRKLSRDINRQNTENLCMFYRYFLQFFRKITKKKKICMLHTKKFSIKAKITPSFSYFHRKTVGLVISQKAVFLVDNAALHYHAMHCILTLTFFMLQIYHIKIGIKMSGKRRNWCSLLFQTKSGTMLWLILFNNLKPPNEKLKQVANSSQNQILSVVCFVDSV